MARAVVLLPGFLDTPRLFRRMERALRAEGHETAAVALEPSTGVRGLDELAEDVARFVDARFGRRRVAVVGFSLGGIVARYYAQRLGGAGRIDRLITLATPHRGTLPAWLLPFRGIRQLRPGSAFLEDLNTDAATLAASGFASIWSPIDYMIVPPDRSRLGFGHERVFFIPIHSWIPRSPRVIREVIRLLAEAPDPPGSDLAQGLPPREA